MSGERVIAVTTRELSGGRIAVDVLAFPTLAFGVAFACQADLFG
jgi:hypothetical protein